MPRVQVKRANGELVTELDWKATHVIGVTPVHQFRVNNTTGWATQEGRLVKPTKLAKLSPYDVWAERQAGMIRLDLAEVALICRAITEPTMRMESLGRVAQWLGGTRVRYSRPENGVDVGRFITLPEVFELPTERDMSGQRRLSPEEEDAQEDDLETDDLLEPDVQPSSTRRGRRFVPPPPPPPEAAPEDAKGPTE